MSSKKQTRPLAMHGIHIAAFLTAITAAIVFARVIYQLRLPANERLLWLAALLAMPLQPLAFYCVRVPMDHWLVSHLGATSPAYIWLTSLYAPLTEEAAKLLPLLIPAICRDIFPQNFVRYALAIGVGFAIGEMGFIADRLSKAPQYEGLPFYQFGGYAVERFMTCVFHSTFVSVSLWRLRNRFALGFAGAVALHWLGNFPLFLMKWDVGGLGRTTWMILIQCVLLIYFFAAIGLLSKFAFGRVATVLVFHGRRQCPECQSEYDPPLMAVNFGKTRYERCPHCQRWHWTRPGEKREDSSSNTPA